MHGPISAPPALAMHTRMQRRVKEWGEDGMLILLALGEEGESKKKGHFGEICRSEDIKEIGDTSCLC